MRRFAFAFALLSAACGATPSAPRSGLPPPIVIADAGAPDVQITERVTPDAPFREHEPPPLTTEPFVFPPAHQSRLSNGVTVLFVPRASSSFVSLRIALACDSLPHPLHPVGTCAAMSHGLGLGTKLRSQWELLDAFGALSMAAPQVRYGDEGIEVLAVAPASRFGAALELMGEEVLAPAFPQASFEREVERLAASIDRAQAVANEDGPRVAGRLMVGAHPLLESWPTPSEIRSVTRADVVRAHARALNPATLIVIAAGNVDEGELVAKVKAVFGALPASTYKAPAERPLPAVTAPRIALVDLPGSSSAFVAVEGVGPSSAKRERHAPVLALGVLADGAQSRLARAVSKSLGHVLTPTKRMWFSRAGGALGVEANVLPSEVSAFLLAAAATMSDLVNTPPTDMELSDARARLLESSAARFESVVDVTETYAALVLTGSNLDYLATFKEDFARETPESVRAAAARYLDPTHMRIVVVGDAAIVEPQLRALNWGPIEHRDASGGVRP